jgi:hypothetical protein
MRQQNKYEDALYYVNEAIDAAEHIAINPRNGYAFAELYITKIALAYDLGRYVLVVNVAPNLLSYLRGSIANHAIDLENWGDPVEPLVDWTAVQALYIESLARLGRENAAKAALTDAVTRLKSNGRSCDKHRKLSTKISGLLAVTSDYWEDLTDADIMDELVDLAIKCGQSSARSTLVAKIISSSFLHNRYTSTLPPVIAFAEKTLAAVLSAPISDSDFVFLQDLIEFEEDKRDIPEAVRIRGLSIDRARKCGVQCQNRLEQLSKPSQPGGRDDPFRLREGYKFNSGLVNL